MFGTKHSSLLAAIATFCGGTGHPGSANIKPRFGHHFLQVFTKQGERECPPPRLAIEGDVYIPSARGTVVRAVASQNIKNSIRRDMRIGKLVGA